MQEGRQYNALFRSVLCTESHNRALSTLMFSIFAALFSNPVFHNVVSSKCYAHAICRTVYGHLYSNRLTFI